MRKKNEEVRDVAPVIQSSKSDVYRKLGYLFIGTIVVIVLVLSVIGAGTVLEQIARSQSDLNVTIIREAFIDMGGGPEKDFVIYAEIIFDRNVQENLTPGQ